MEIIISLTLFHMGQKDSDEHGMGGGGADSAPPPITFKFVSLFGPNLARW